MKQNRVFLLVGVIVGYSQGLWAADAVCIDEKEYTRVSEVYQDLLSKYDLPTVAQAFLDVSSAVQDLKEQVTICQKSLNEADQKRCVPLIKQYNTTRFELDALMRRFHVAIDMQEYLFTLKIKLERPQCLK